MRAALPRRAVGATRNRPRALAAAKGPVRALIFSPFGGGAARVREGRRVGVRAASVQGLAGQNMTALLEGADTRFAFRHRYGEAMARWLNEKVSNTDNLEHGFGVGVQLNGGVKGEFDQMAASMVRADFYEQLKNDRSTNIVLPGSRTDMYDEVELADKKNTFNNGSAEDPRSKGQHEYDDKKLTIARRASTSSNEMVRDRFRGKGLGKSE